MTVDARAVSGTLVACGFVLVLTSPQDWLAVTGPKGLAFGLAGLHLFRFAAGVIICAVGVCRWLGVGQWVCLIAFALGLLLGFVSASLFVVSLFGAAVVRSLFPFLRGLVSVEVHLTLVISLLATIGAVFSGAAGALERRPRPAPRSDSDDVAEWNPSF